MGFTQIIFLSNLGLYLVITEYISELTTHYIDEHLCRYEKSHRKYVKNTLTFTLEHNV